MNERRWAIEMGEMSTTKEHVTPKSMTVVLARAAAAPVGATEDDPPAVDLLSWREKIEADMLADDEDLVQRAQDEDGGRPEDADGSFHDYGQAYSDGELTIGCVGYPNVGKSSLINGLVGRKVRNVAGRRVGSTNWSAG